MSGGASHGGGDHKEPAQGGGKKKKLIIVIVAALVLAAGGAFAAFKTGMLGHKDPAAEEAKTGEAEGEKKEADPHGGKASEEGGAHKGGKGEEKEGHGAKAEKDEGGGDEKEKEKDGEGHGGGDKKPKKGGKHGDGEAIGPFYYDMQEFVVNLDVGSASPSFLKMTVSLELPSELDTPKIEAALPRIRDSFYVYIRELRREDLRGSQGVYRLREELLLRINKIVAPAKVNDILFKEILIQ